MAHLKIGGLLLERTPVDQLFEEDARQAWEDAEEGVTPQETSPRSGIVVR